MNTALVDLAKQVQGMAQHDGADEVIVSVSSGSHVSIQRRGGQVEQCTEATTRGLVLALLVGDRFTSNSTTDLRPDALKAFVKRSVASAHVLEPDIYRRLPEPELCGRGVTEAHLDQDDPAWGKRTPADRHTQAEELEKLLIALGGSDTVSCAASIADERSEGVRVMSNGFCDGSGGAWFSAGCELTLADGDKRPEGYMYYAARHLADLPPLTRVAEECVANTRERIGSRAIASGSYPMVLENRTAGRVLGMLGGPLSGAAIHEGRSCLADRLDTPIASPILTIVDDPTLPRGLGSRPWDGDAFPASRRTIVEGGVLKTYYMSQYYARKLDVAPTTGGRSNWVVTPGEKSFTEMVRELPRAILVTGFLGGNHNSTTGDFSFGIRGVLLEKGERVHSLSEMNVSGNLLPLFERLQAVGNDPWLYSSVRSPSLVFDGVSFSGS